MFFLFLLALSVFDSFGSSICKLDEKRQLAIIKIEKLNKSKLTTSCSVNLQSDPIDRISSSEIVIFQDQEENDEEELNCFSFSALMSFLCMISFC